MLTETQRHYDLLIAEGNDPVLDPPALAAYMDGWDGPEFLRLLALTGTERILEIGIGTGRLALRVAPRCRHLTGIDLSSATLERAAQHLSHLPNVTLFHGDFVTLDIPAPFDVIYSSLTLLHIRNKAAAVCKMAELLSPGGRLVLSLDKGRASHLTFGERRLRVYPDAPEDIARLMEAAGLTIQSITEIERAWLIKAARE